MFKKISIFLLGIVNTCALSANINDSNHQWGVEAEFLYLLPTVDDTFYATEGSAVNSTASKLTNDFSFTPGFRVAGYYGLCNQGALIVRYSRLRSTTTNTAFDATLGPVVDRFGLTAAAGQGSSHLDLLYQNVDVLYSLGLWNNCKFALDLQAGLEYAYIRLNEAYDYNLSGGFSTQSSSSSMQEKTWGIGPQMGIAFNWDIYNFSCSRPGKLSVVSRAASSLLVSETTGEQNGILPGFIASLQYNVKDDSTWRIVPAFHARLGLNYETCFSCFNATFEVGYEFHHYIRAISREKFYNTDPAVSAATSTYYDFGANGLYVSCGVAF